MSWWSELVAVFKPAPVTPVAAAPAPEPQQGGRVVIDVLKFAPAPKPQMPEVAEAERRMLAAIQSGDDHGRAIYGDWLEDLGRVVEAEYVRAELAVQASAGAEAAVLKEALDRFHFAARRVSTDFKAYLSRPAVEGCLGFTLQCPKQWSKLKLTGDARERSCDVCQKTVRFCETVEEAQAHANDGGCVAIELSRPRRPGDLQAAQFVRMGMVAPRHPR